jgi:hypothetical protein
VGVAVVDCRTVRYRCRQNQPSHGVLKAGRPYSNLKASARKEVARRGVGREVVDDINDRASALTPSPIASLPPAWSLGTRVSEHSEGASCFSSRVELDGCIHATNAKVWRWSVQMCGISPESPRSRT